MKAHLGMVGGGRLFEASRTLLALDHTVETLPGGPETLADLPDAIVLVSDGWEREAQVRWSDWCLGHGLAMLPVHVEPGFVVVGPYVGSAGTGCLRCAEARRLRLRSDAVPYRAAVDRFAAQPPGCDSSWLTSFASTAVSSLVGAEVTALLACPQAMRTRGAFVRVGLDGLRTQRHAFLPDPCCEGCGRLGDDSRQAAVLALRSRPKAGPDSYRIRSLAAERDRLLALYVDEEVGLVRAGKRDGRGVIPTAAVFVGLRTSGRGGPELAFGRQPGLDGAWLTAVAEGLERYGGVGPGGRRTVVRGSYRQLRQEALDPVSLGLHPPEEYAKADCPRRRYHEDLSVNWVWGYSFRRREPILVPESCAYYGTYRAAGSERPFVYETSNGCALGGCLEEAILHGILEVAERDAFLMTWYARMPVPRIDPASARDPGAAVLVESIEESSGCRVEVFNTTLEQGVPSFWVMAVDERGLAHRPRALCAAGAGLSPEQALTNALLELAAQVATPVDYYRRNRGRVQRMLTDPYAVVDMEDHMLLNAAPEAFARFGFLAGCGAVQSFGEAFAEYYRTPPNEDLLADLDETVNRYLDTGLDVIVVDQSTPEHAAGGFSCVKVIIPGCLPMTYGHAARRTWGLDRLHRVPAALGHTGVCVTDADINPHPHPFP